MIHKQETLDEFISNGNIISVSAVGSAKYLTLLPHQLGSGSPAPCINFDWLIRTKYNEFYTSIDEEIFQKIASHSWFKDFGGLQIIEKIKVHNPKLLKI